MVKTISILASALLGASLVGVVAVNAQQPASNGCGPVTYSTATQTYTSAPCNTGEDKTAVSGAGGAAAPCKPESYDQASQSYVGVPCVAGTTYENPSWKGVKAPQ
jgi:hypothetical protein